MGSRIGVQRSEVADSLADLKERKSEIVEIQIIAALLTTSVSKAVLRGIVDHADDQTDKCMFPAEHWRRPSVAHPANP